MSRCRPRHCVFWLGLLFAASSVMASDSARLADIIERHWEWTLQSYPERRIDYGDPSGNRLWTDRSLDAYAARNRARQEFLQQLHALEPAKLSEEEKLNLLMLQARLKMRIDHYKHGLHLIAVDMRSGPQHWHTVAERIPLRTVQDFEDWLARLSLVPQQLRQITALLDEGINRDRTQARIVMSRVPDQIALLLQMEATASPFYSPFERLPTSIDGDTAERLRVQARTLIREVLNPAYRKFDSYLQQTYLPSARSAPGIGSLQGGKAAYRKLVEAFTTTEQSPEAIHQIGLDEVKRIRREMQSVIDELEFDGDIAAFNEYLRTSPTFYFNSPEALLEGYRAIAKRLDPQLVKLLGRLPRMPYGVRPIPDELAPDTTTAYYMRPAADGTRPGWYYVNLYRPDVRPKYEMEVLSVHEAVPGHHLQIALAQELEGIPEFRRNSSVTAFIEGWGLYSERLGYDMGLYQDPYSRYGQLTYDMWRAVRLVVDTGLHYFGWDRQRAIDYFLANAAKSEADIINEIDRYIGWPAQALAYKIGQLKMLELREQAERTLGDEFDIRAFHDHLLGAGAIPLNALELRMTHWLRTQTDHP